MRTSRRRLPPWSKETLRTANSGARKSPCSRKMGLRRDSRHPILALHRKAVPGGAAGGADVHIRKGAILGHPCRAASAKIAARPTPLADDASSRLWHRACRPDQQISTATGNVAGNGNGWVNNPQIEAAIAARYDATSLDEEETIARRLKTLAVDHVLNAPLGAMLGHHAWRKTSAAMCKRRCPFFWRRCQDGVIPQWTCTSNPPRRLPG